MADESAVSPGLGRRSYRRWALAASLVVVLVAIAAVAWGISHRHRTSVAPPPADGPALTLDLGNGVKLEMVRVPAGHFVMGSPDDEPDRDACEGPQHTVTIAHDFFIGRFEVTQTQWMAVMGQNQSQNRADPQQPAECVSWGDCQKFCDVVSQRVGRPVRLPSEAEWEYACRAGTNTVFAFGDTLSSLQANFNGQDPYGDAPVGPNLQKPVPIGQYQPNGFGLFDMHGNVCEWCQDVFHDSYTGAPTDGSPWMSGGENPNNHVYRGGAYNNEALSCRSAMRFAADVDCRVGTLGFRIAADVRGGNLAPAHSSSRPAAPSAAAGGGERH